MQSAWHEILSSKNFGQQPIASEEQLSRIVALLVRCRIDPHLFAGNLVAIVMQGRQTQADLDRAGARSVTKSAAILSDPALRPLHAPLWVLAAFPDAITWHEGRVRNRTVPADQRTAESWLSLVESYLTESRSDTVEASVPLDSTTDPYAGSEILAATRDESNFSMIARLTAACYFRLKIVYGDRFPNDESLMAAAGILDASVYIHQTHETTEKDILSLAQQTRNSGTKLLDFVSLFETLLLSIDNPNVSPEEVFRTVESQKEAVVKAIEQGKVSAQNEASVIAGVEQFMSDKHHRRTRRLLGIRNG